MNPKTVAKVKALLAVGVMLGRISQAEADAIGVLLDARVKDSAARGLRKLPRRIVRLRDA